MENFELENYITKAQEELARDIKSYLEQKSPEAVIWDDCDSALVGTARLLREDHWREVAMYDYELLVQNFMYEFRAEDKTESEVEQEAIEWVDHNISSVWVGPFTPLILYN